MARREHLLVTPDRWVVYPFLESALEVGHRFGTTPKPHLLAEVITTLPADAALAAWDANLKGDPVANAEASNLGSDGNDGARGLVPQRKRHASTEISIGELFVIRHVRTADACCLDSYLKFTQPRFFDDPPFLTMTC